MTKICILIFSYVISFPVIAQLQANPFNINFGIVESGSSKSYSKSTTIYNIGEHTTKVQITTIDCDPTFSLRNRCFTDLDPDTSCVLSIFYRPATAGIHSCKIEAQDDHGDVETIRVNATAVEKN